MALTNATTLADYGAGIGTQGTTLKVDANNKRVGVGTTNPQGPEGSLQVGTGITFFGNTGIVSAIGGKFSGDFTVGGALTFEDVTNIDSVGIITAQSHVSIADSILHTGDTDTSIRFPEAGTFTVETNGSEAFRVDSSQRLLLGLTAARSIADGTPKLQVEGTAGTASLGLVRNQNNSGGSNLSFAKSRSASLGGSTIVQDDDTLGSINFAGADGTDINSIAASIIAAVDGTPGSNDMPGRLVFKTTADGAASATERLRIDSSGNVILKRGADVGNILQINGADTTSELFEAGITSGHVQFTATHASGGSNTCGFIFRTRQGSGGTGERMRLDSSGRLLVGHTSNATPYVAGNVQVSGTDSSAAVSIARYQNSASNPYLALVKSRGGLGAATIVQDDDGLGYIAFVGADGNDLTSEGAAITAEVDGTPGQDDMPGRIVFKTTSDGSNSATERLRIDRNGRILKTGTDARANFFNSTWSPGIQSENTDDKKAALSIVCAGNNANQGILLLGNTRNASVGGNTIVQDDDGTGIVSFQGNDGSDMVETARIESKVDGTPGANDMPGRLVFRTTADGASSSTERMRIDSSGRVLIGSDTVQTLPTESRLQLTGTDFATSSIRMHRSESGTSGPSLLFVHTRGTVSSPTVLGQADEYGKIRFYGHDGTDVNNFAAEIKANVDGTPGTDDTPGRLVFSTASDGANTVTERMRIDSDGSITKPTNPLLQTNLANTYGSSGSLVSSPATAILQTAASIDKGNNGWTTSGSNAYTFVCPVTGIYAVHAHFSLGGITGGGGSLGRIIFVMGYTAGGGNLPLDSYVELMDVTAQDHMNYSYYNTWNFTAGTRVGAGMNGVSGTQSNYSLQWGIHLLQ